MPALLAWDLERALTGVVSGERGAAILKLVQRQLGIAPGTSLDHGGGAKAEADNPRR